MINLSFYLENWVLPMAIVGLIYLVFLVPTYFLIKKYKPNYWLMIGIGVFIVYLINIVFFFLSVRSNYEYFLLDLLFFSFFTNSIFFLFTPILVKKFLKDKIKYNLIISYSLLFVLQILYGYFLLVLIARGAASIIY